jgi:fatty-acyl-CoA synthase
VCRRRPDEKWGETVTAVVVLRPDADASEAGVATMTEQIQASVKDRKGSVQVPKQVVVVDALPLTGLGKPDKKAVRARFWEGAARASADAAAAQHRHARPDPG